MRETKALETASAKAGPRRRYGKLFWRIALDWNNVQLAIGLLLILLGILSPLVIRSPYFLSIIILTVLYAQVGLAWNVAGGYAGLMLFGFIPFFGLGAYTTIILFNHLGVTPWLGILIGTIPAMALGLLVAFLTLRYGLKEDYFILFTMALMVVLALLFSQIDIAGGALGIWIPYSEPRLADMSFRSKTPYLFIALGLLLFTLLVNYLIARAKLGRYLVAIRENEDAAQALGVNTSYYKTVALLVSTGLNGLAGGFYVIYTTFIEPPLVFGADFNFELLVAPIIGGKGTLLGPILGAILNKPTAELVRGYFSANRAGTTLIIYGLLLMIFILFLPDGVIGLIRGPYQRWKNKVSARRRQKEI